MFRATPSIASAVYRLVARWIHIISTMYPLAPDPHIGTHQYHDCRKSNSNDFGLESSIFVKVDNLCSTGRSSEDSDVIPDGSAISAGGS
jgi:hypothetical protein